MKFRLKLRQPTPLCQRQVMRTIADLDVSENLQTRNLGEAIQYRTLDRTYGA